MSEFNVLKRITKHVLLSVVSLVCGLILVELSLNLGSLIYKKFFYTKNIAKGTQDVNCRYVFIGDSWVEGGGAPFGKGFPEQFIEELKTLHPLEDCTYKKLCWSASNTSQAVLQLISALRNGDFEWAIVLAGANNGWNPEVINEVDCFAYDYYGWAPIEKTSFNLLTRIGLRRLGKLFSLYNYNISDSKSISSQYPWGLLSEIEDIFGSEDVSMEQIRKFLVAHPNKAKDYQEFFMAVKLTFGNQHEPTESFLRSKGLWKPKLIDKLGKERRNDKKLQLAWQRAGRDLRLIAKLCKENKKRLILLTYPSSLTSFDTINTIIRKVAREENIVLIDQDKMFEEKLKYVSDWEIYFAKHHPNEKGYNLMAKNLISLFIDD